MLMIVLGAGVLCADQTNPLDDLLSQPKPKPAQQTTADQDSITNDIIRVNYSKKSAHLAMLMSALVPGAGQYYADKTSITTYIFPVIELAVIGGMIYYDNQGDKKAKEYKKYVNEEIEYTIGGYTYTGPRYNRGFQAVTEDSLMRVHSADIYDGEFFSLDTDNTQHFYEDIGKYDKYIFGWVDWYARYADASLELIPSSDIDADGNYIGDSYPTGFHPMFFYSIMNPQDPRFNSYENKWLGNIPLDGSSANYEVPESPMRNAYIKMRQDAEDRYRSANYISFALALNHIASAIDAARLTSKVNRLYLSDNNVKLKYYAAVSNGRLTPMLGLNITF
jgi:hypothetical protein